MNPAPKFSSFVPAYHGFGGRVLQSQKIVCDLDIGAE
jgi:hypothetical protein